LPASFTTHNLLTNVINSYTQLGQRLGCSGLGLEHKTQKNMLGGVEGWRGSFAAPFPAPAQSNVAGGFPALRFPAWFASRVMGPIEW